MHFATYSRKSRRDDVRRRAHRPRWQFDLQVLPFVWSITERQTWRSNMSRWAHCFVLVASLFLAGSCLAAQEPNSTKDEPMPEVLWNPLWEHPFWVSAEAAFDSKGELKPELFHPGLLSSVKSVLAGPEIDGCIRFEEVYLEFVDPQPRDSVDSALASTDLVIHGKITGSAVGFATTIPATLFRIEILGLGKGSTPLREAYFAWPIADLTVAGKRICKTDYRYAALPKIGDEIVAFVTKTMPEDFPMLQLESPGDVIILRSSKIDYPSTMTRANEDGKKPANPANKQELLQRLGITESQR